MKKKGKAKRLWSLILTLAMVLSLMAGADLAVYADESESYAETGAETAPETKTQAESNAETEEETIPETTAQTEEETIPETTAQTEDETAPETAAEAEAETTSEEEIMLFNLDAQNLTVNLSEISSVSNVFLHLRVENGTKQYSADDGANWTDYTGSLILTGAHTRCIVTVESGEHDVTMNNASLENAVMPEQRNSSFRILSGASVKLTLLGENTVKSPADDYAAVEVAAGASLTITENSGGTLNAVGGKLGAGIGGGNKSLCGNITINGGTINAASGSGAGIGGGYSWNISDVGGDIMINGGVVNASSDGGAGIGGGYYGNGNNITINGGVVTASSGSGAGIGGGSEGNGGIITIYGGIINASASNLGTGIGGGNKGDGGTVTIHGGTVIATGGSRAAGIGGGYYGSGGNVVITGGNIKATCGEEGAAAIGAGYSGSDEGTLTNEQGNPVTLAVIQMDGLYEESSIMNLAGEDGVLNYGLKDFYTLDTNMLYLYLTAEEFSAITKVTVGDITYIAPRNVGGVLYFPRQEPVVNLSDIPDVLKLKEEEGCTFYTVDGSSWIYYTGVLTVTGGADLYKRMSVESGTHDVMMQDAALQGMTSSEYPCAFSIAAGASVNLTLSGSNSAISSSNNAGIYVPKGASLTITEDSTGNLEAKGAAQGAGIGGGANGDGGTVTIRGGTVIATGGLQSAGIGGGFNGDGGAVTITGGTVIAASGSQSAGIGGGFNGDGGAVTITGGNVKSEGTYLSIGGGYGGSPNSGTLTGIGGEKVSLVTITLADVNDGVPVTALEGVEGYGLNQVYTLDGGKLYFYLPEGAGLTSIVAGGITYLKTTDGDSGTYEPVIPVAVVEIDGHEKEYMELAKAWADAKNQPNGATVTLLKDADDLTAALEVTEGDNITFVGGSYSLVGSIVDGGVFNVTGGSLTVRSGAVKNEAEDSSYGIFVNGGTVTFTGGSFTGGSCSVYCDDNSTMTVRDLLAEGCRYYDSNGMIVPESALNSKFLAHDGYGTVTVAAVPLKITAQPTAQTLTYGYTEAPTLTVAAEAANGAETMTYQWYQDGKKIADADTASLVLPVGLDAGSYEYFCEVSLNGYMVASEAAVVTVNAKPITVTADDQRKTYGEADPVLTYTPDGLVGSDVLELTVRRESGGTVGEYTIQVFQAEGANPNYDITFVDGTLRIEPLTAQLVWKNTSLTYNGEKQQPTAYVANLLSDDTCIVTVEGAQTNAGSGYTAAATGLSNNNYRLPEEVAQAFNIGPKNITVDIIPNGGVYNGLIIPAAADLKDVVEGDVGTVDVILTYTGTANDNMNTYNGTEVPKLAGSYTVTASLTNTVTNYKLTGDVTAGFEVARADAALSVNSVPDKVYGDDGFSLMATHNGDGNVSYRSSNDDVAAVDAQGNVTLHNAGEAVITVSLEETANYKGDEFGITIKVGRLDDVLTVEETSYEVTYGGADFSIGYSTDSKNEAGFTSSDESVVTVDSGGKVHIVGVGEAKVTLETAGSGNYNAVSKTVIVKVAPKSVTVTADNKKMTYGDAEPELTWTAEGTVDGDKLTDITVSRTNGENVGSYVLTATQKAGANPNYDIAFVEGTLTVEPKNINGAVVKLGDALTANGSTQTQKIQSVVVTNSKGETLEVTYDVTGNTGKEPGTYVMTLTGTGNFAGTVTCGFVIAEPDDEPETEPGSETEPETEGGEDIGSDVIDLQIQKESGAPDVEVQTGKQDIIEILTENGGLTAEELAQAADGAEINMIFKVTDVSDTISEESRTQIEQAAKDYTVGQYINIALYKQIVQDGQAGELSQITDIRENIRISVKVPEQLLNKDNTVTRTFWIVRNYEGKAEFLPAAYDAEMSTLTFETNKFSDYAIVYQDTKRTEGAKPGTSGGGMSVEKNNRNPLNTATGTVPRTGDNSRLWLWTVLLFASGIVLAGIGVSVKRKKRKQ